MDLAEEAIHFFVIVEQVYCKKLERRAVKYDE